MGIAYARQGKRLGRRCVVCPKDEPYERMFSTCIRHDAGTFAGGTSIYQLDDGRVVTSHEVEYVREVSEQGKCHK